MNESSQCLSPEQTLPSFLLVVWPVLKQSGSGKVLEVGEMGSWVSSYYSKSYINTLMLLSCGLAGVGCCNLPSYIMQLCLLISGCWRSLFNVASESATCNYQPWFLFWEGREIVGSPLKCRPWWGWPASCELGGWRKLEGASRALSVERKEVCRGCSLSSHTAKAKTAVGSF